MCYNFGRGVECDYNQAVKWYQEAAEQGHTKAQTNLGVCYENGVGVPQSKSEAIKWYRKAAEKGVKQAIENLKELEVEY